MSHNFNMLSNLMKEKTSLLFPENNYNKINETNKLNSI